MPAPAARPFQLLQMTAALHFVVYLWLKSLAEITNVFYHIDSPIATDRHAAAAERVDSSSVLPGAAAAASQQQY